MDEPVFPYKSKRPSDADLALVLGRTKGHWDRLVAHALEADPQAKAEWKHYFKKEGWIHVVRGKKRSLLYMVPSHKHFRIGLALRESAVEAAETSDLPKPIKQLIRDAPKYPEGRGVRLAVKSAADVKVVKKLIALKLES